MAQFVSLESSRVLDARSLLRCMYSTVHIRVGDEWRDFVVLVSLYVSMICYMLAHDLLGNHKSCRMISLP